MSCIRLFLVELHASQWVGILLARLVVGSLFFLSGRGKLFLNEHREQMRQTLREARIPFPELNAFLVSTVEFVFGLLLIAGAVTPVADRLACRFFLSSGGTLPRHPGMAVSFGPRMGSAWII
jgi:putative oxidoreductase